MSIDLFKEVPFPLILLRRDTQHLETNPAYVAEMGWSSEQAIEKLVEAVMTMSGPVEAEAFKKAALTGHLWQGAAKGATEGHRFYETKVICKPVVSRSNEAYSLISLQMMFQSDALLSSEDRWQLAVEGSGDGVWDWVVPKESVWYSPGYKHMLGFEVDEMGSTLDEWANRVPAEDLQHCQRVLQDYFKKNSGVHHVEFRMQCKDGSYKWIEARGRIIERDAEGTPLRMIGMHRDITQQKVRAARIYEHALSLDRSQQRSALVELATIFAHEISQPLTAIKNYVSGVLRSRRTDNQTGNPDEILSIVLSEVDKLSQVVANIRGLISKQPQLSRFCLANLVTETIELVQPQLQRLGETIDWTPSSHAIEVTGDRSLIQQVLVNLIVNAAEANQEHGKKTIHITLAIPHKTVRCSVADNGAGVPVALQDQIFAPFFSTKREGLGLGLAICGSILELHHSTLRVENAPAGGAVFTFELRQD